MWLRLMQADPEAMPYQSPAWIDSICAMGGYRDVSRFYDFGRGRHYVMPLVARSGLSSVLNTASSLPPAWGIGGLIGSAVPHVDELGAIFADLRDLPYQRIKIRPNPRDGELWAAARPDSVLAVPRLAHVLDLEGGFDHVWTKRFSGNTRNAVRKAEKLGIVTQSDTSGALLPVFYELLQRSFDHWAAKQNEPRLLTRLRGGMRDPIEKFQTIVDKLGEDCRIWAAWVDGRPAAAIFVLQQHNVNDARGAMDRALVGSTGANDLIQKLAIEHAANAGCRYYHMGESGTSASLALFKARFGAAPYAYAEYIIEKLPITRLDAGLRAMVKRVIGFKDN
jgi:hypothetical protein